MGLTRFELVTPRLSSVCSNQLSYRPRYSHASGDAGQAFKEPLPVLSKLDRTCVTQNHCSARSILECLKSLAVDGVRCENHSRKEVIQPQVLLQLPCYDFTPITDHTLGASLPCGLVWRLLVQPAFVM